MAKRVIETLIDDLDGSEATATVAFAYKGTNYEIDLNDANAEKLDDALKPWIDLARKAKTSGSSNARTSSKSTGRSDRATIRKWANDNGYNVGDRGRIPANVIEAYDAAH